MLNDPISQTHTSRFPRNQAESWFSFHRIKQKKRGVGWHWWEEETVFKSHIAPLNVLHDLYPETQAQHLSKPKRLSRKAEGGRAGRGGSLGRMLGHSPGLPRSQPSFKRQHRKKKKSNKPTTTKTNNKKKKKQQKGKAARPGAPLTPLLFWGSSCQCCIVLGLKGAHTALSEPRLRAGRD